MREALFVTSSAFPFETPRLLLLQYTPAPTPTAIMRFLGALFSSSLWLLLLLLLQTLLHSDVVLAAMDDAREAQGTAAPTPQGTHFEVLNEELLEEILEEESVSPSAEESILEGLGLETKPPPRAPPPPPRRRTVSKKWCWMRSR